MVADEDAEVTPVWHMALIHRMFRARFAELVDLVPAVPDDDLTRRRAVLDHLDFNLGGLHHHHVGEDTHLWPLLNKRARAEAATIRRMHTDHDEILQLSERVRELAARWMQAPATTAASAAAELTEALGAFRTALVDHLDEEERVVVPLLAQHVSVREWTDFGKAMASPEAMPRDKLHLFMGSLVEVATPRELVEFLPWPARLIWRLSGRRRYERELAVVRGVA